MSDRFPLIVNPSTGRIEELAAGDNLNLTNNSIVGATTVTASTFVGNLTGTSDIAISLTDAGNILDGTLDVQRLNGYYNIGVGTATNLTNAANIQTGTIDPARLDGDYDINITGLAASATSLVSAENILDGIISADRLTGTYNINITGTAFDAIGAASSVAVVSTNDFNTFYVPFFRNFDTDDTPNVDVSSLVYNPGENRLGIGSTSPTVSLDVIGDINASGYGRYSTIQASNLTISGITTSEFIRSTLINNTGIATVGSISIGATQVVSSLRELQNIVSIDETTRSTLETALELEPNNFNSLNVSGIGTFADIVNAQGGLDVTGHTDLDTVTVASAATITSATITSATITSTETQTLVVSAGSSVGSLSIGSTQVISNSRGLQNIVSIDETTRSTLETALELDPNNFNSLNVSGVGTFTGKVNLDSGVEVNGQSTLENLSVSGVGTITTINNTNSNTTGVATITTINNTNSNISGVATINSLGATTATIGSVDITESSIGDIQVSGGATVSGLIDANGGLDVTGQSELDNVNAGVVTATEIYGNGVNLVGIVTQIAAGIGIDLVSSQASGKGVVEVTSYKPIGKTIFVSQTGNDTNTGLSENHPKKTIKAAAAIAFPGDTIKVYPGVYVENNPIVLSKNVSVEGTELRNCVVTPRYTNRDLFHVNNSCHITDVSFVGPDMTDGAAIVAFQPLLGVSTDRYFDAARLLRSNLDYIAKESVGFLTSGFSGFAGNHREQDAARLIDLNLDFIAAEAIGFLTSTDYKSPAFTIVNASGIATDPVNCSDDIKDILRSISYDLKAGSNKKAIGAGLSYYDDGGTLLHITGTDPNGYSVKEATIAAINHAVGIATHVINNISYGGTTYSGLSQDTSSYSPILVSGGCTDTIPKIESLAGIVTSILGDFNAAAGITTVYGVTLESGDCADDVKDVWKCVIHDITRGGNSRCVAAGKSYYDEDWNLIPQILKNPGEVDQSVATIDYSFGIARAIINNSTWGSYPVGVGTAVTNALYDNTTGITTITATNHGLAKDDAVKVVGLGFTCPSGPGIVTYPSGSLGYIFNVRSVINSNTFEVVVGQSTLPHTYNSGGTVQKYINFQNNFTQVKDLGIQPDPLTGFNNAIDGCANVVSAIRSCVGVVTTIIGYGSTSGITTTYPGNSGIGFTSVIGITSAIYNNTSGDTTLIAPNLSVKEGDVIEVRDLVFDCESSGVIGTQKYPSGKYGYLFDVVSANQDGSFTINTGVSTIPHNYVSGGFVVDRAIGITTASYDNVTGITTVTAPGAVVKVGQLVKLHDLEFSCASGAGTTTLYPTGNLGYEFIVTEVIGTGTTFVVNTGVSTIPHTYEGGGVVIPPYSPGVGPITQGPYIRNCTNFVPKSIGMKIDGFAADPGDKDDIGVTGTMSVDSYTQYNQGGIGVSITNGAYAQLVSIFTICNDIAIFTSSGGQCDITNSNSSFGRLGLVAEGVGDASSKSIYRSTGVAVTDVTQGNNVMAISGLGTFRPYDGQVCYFGELYNFVDTITITNGGSGYLSAPRVNISAPEGENGITAQASSEIDAFGRVTAINIVNSGTQYLNPPTVTIDPPPVGVTATADVTKIQPIYYKVDSATLPSAGISTVSFLQTLNNTVSAGTTVYFTRVSLQITSSHSFEWVGSGNDINTAKPALGGVVIPENEVIQDNGGIVVYTSTDQAGNFKIGDGVVINQATGQISGRDFTKALFVTLTPFILALAE